MKQEKIAQKNLNTRTELTENPVLGRKKRMKEEKTQGMSTKTTIKDSYNTNKITENKKLL
jgi:hypothetical protein